MIQFQEIKNKLLTLFDQLKLVTDFTPNPNLDRLFSELVHIAQQASAPNATAALDDPQTKALVPFLQEISARGESELEKHWSNKICLAADTHQTLHEFPYLNNYEMMVRDEVSVLKANHLDTTKKVLLVGGGALPLTAILMAMNYNYYVDCLDYDSDACFQAEKLIRLLGLSSKVQIIEGDVLAINDFTEYSIIFIAALAGSDEDSKTKILDHLQTYTQNNTYVLLRSVEDLGVVLYPKVTSQSLRNIKVLYSGERNSNYINTIILGKFCYE